MGKGKRTEEDFLIAENNQSVELVEKGSKRSLQIRRALEDREENKRLSALFGNEYWSDF